MSRIAGNRDQFLGRNPSHLFLVRGVDLAQWCSATAHNVRDVAIGAIWSRRMLHSEIMTKLVSENVWQIAAVHPGAAGIRANLADTRNRTDAGQGINLPAVGIHINASGS